MGFLARAVATGGFVGYAPIMPGTVGSFLAVLLYWLVPESDTWRLIPALVVLFFSGAWAAASVDRQTQKTDNQIIVIDEIVGMLLTLLFIEKRVIWLAIGFVLFRLFDIVKPPPVRLAERAPGGWGVMLDDVVAGVYAAVCLRAVYFFVHAVL